MNLAIGALVVALLLLPGIVFRYLYIRSDALRKSIDFSLLNEAIFILVPSLLLHLLGRLFAESALGWDVNSKQIYWLVSNNAEVDMDIIDGGYTYFVAYILTLSALAGGLAFLFQRLVVHYGWDEKYKLLRIYSDWDKYFSGHILPREQRERIDYIQVDILAGSSGGDVIYTGVLQAYSLNKEQGIDRIFLNNAYRRVLALDAKSAGSVDSPAADHPPYRMKDFDDRYYALPGGYFVIPFSQVRNLNISYNTLEEQKDEDILPGRTAPFSAPLPDGELEEVDWQEPPPPAEKPPISNVPPPDSE